MPSPTAAGRLRNLAGWLLAFCLVELAAWQLQRSVDGATQQRLVRRASEARAVLEGELNAAIYLTVGLVTYLQSQDGRLEPQGLAPWMRILVEQGRHIRNIGLAPDNRIAYVYPLAGNEAAIGLYYPDVPEQWPAVERLIRERRATLAGPLELRQGGRGLIYRTPVFIQDRYWGLISTVMDADSLLGVLAAHDRQSGISLSLSAVNAHTGSATEPPFWGARVTGGGRSHHQIDLALPGVTWRLTASEPDNNTPRWLVRGAGGLLLLLIYLGFGHARRIQQKRRQAEAAASAHQVYNSLLLDHVVDGVLSLDSHCRLLSLNAAAESLLGQHEASAKGRALSDYLPEGAEGIDAWLRQHVPSGNGSRTTHLQREDGSTLPVEISAVPLTDIAGAAWLVVLRDISARLHNERLKNEFVAIVSHELRTPLAAISGAVGLLAGGATGPLPEPAQHLLQIAKNNTLRLNRLVNDLLDMERLSTGKLPLQMSAQPLLPLLRHALQDNATYAQPFRVTLTLDDEDARRAAPLWVTVDALRLQQVLTNLLGNAVKFSPANSTVQLQVQVPPGTVRIAVRDQGPGVPEAYRTRIFEKFSQADASDTREKGGTGLGLAIARSLVEQMGGRLDLESPADGGACFLVELPTISPPTGDGS